MNSFRYLLLYLFSLSHLYTAFASLLHSLPLSPLHSAPGLFSVSLHIHHPLIASAEPFDLLILSHEHFHTLLSQRQPDLRNLNFLPPYSLLSRTSANAHRRDEAFFHFHHPPIRQIGQYAVLLRARNSTILSSADIHFHFEATTTQRSQKCPIVLREDPPTTRRRQITIPNSDFPPARQIVPRIVGGDFANQRLQNSLAVIESPDGGHCSGSLISKTWILSAAHCKITDDWQVAVGASSAFQNSADRIRIKNVITHERWGSEPMNNQFDISLIELQWAARSDDFMQINDNASVPEQGSFSRTAGYGVIGFETSEPLEDLFRLRQVDVPITPNFRCSEQYNDQGDPAFDARRQVCAGYFNRGECDSCQGDSGGPLIQYDLEGNAVQIGIVSFGLECGRPNFPGVYVRTESFLDWMVGTGAIFQKKSRTQAVFAEGSDPSQQSSNTAVIVGISVGALVGTIILVSLLVLVVRKVRSQNNPEQQEPDGAANAVEISSMGPRPSQGEESMASPPVSYTSLFPGGIAPVASPFVPGSPVYTPNRLSQSSPPASQPDVTGVGYGMMHGIAPPPPVAQYGPGPPGHGTGPAPYGTGPPVYGQQVLPPAPPAGYMAETGVTGYTGQPSIYPGGGPPPPGVGYAAGNLPYEAPTGYGQAGLQAPPGHWGARDSNE